VKTQQADRPPHLLPDGAIRDPARVAAGQWRDPDDAQAMERGPDGRRHQRTIAGYRAIDPLSRLPCAAEHHKAARRLRDDWERGSGARGARSSEYVDGSSRDRDSMSGQIEARRRYEAAVRDIGLRVSAYVLPVVLCGWTAADLVERHGGNAMAMQGRIMAGLDRLAEHYFGAAGVAAFEPETALMVDAAVVDLPQDRLGRAKR
jgi:hypothetical protein